MIRKKTSLYLIRFILFLLIALLSVTACTTTPAQEATALSLPALSRAALAGRPLRVVATTSIIGDVVQQVGGSTIDLTTLMQPGQDPHSYVASAGDLAAAANADVIFIHGWNLEEGLAGDLARVADGVPLVPVAAGIEPRTLEDDDHGEEGNEAHNHGPADPHTWLDPLLVKQWVDNIVHTLGELDPAHADLYTANGAAYQAELDELAGEMEAAFAEIPAGRRVLVTNHDSLGYLADRFDFDILGSVIPAASTLAEPAAAELSALVETMNAAGVCTIFPEHSASDELARAVAGELSGCTEVQIIPLYTGALGPVGSEADSYLGMMRANTAAIVRGLSESE